MARTDLAAIPAQSGAEQWSQTFAMVLAFTFAIGLAFVILFNRWNRPDLDKDHAAHVLSQLNGFGGSGGGAVVIRSADTVDDVETLRDLRGLFHGETSGEVRVRSATMEILREVRGELRARTPDVSRVPVRTAQEAVATAVLGALAVVPVATWREATDTGTGALITPGDVFAGANAVTDAGLTALTAFPYTDVLFAFALTLGILGADAIWTLWFLPPAVLLVLAGSYWMLELRLDADRALTGPPTRVWAVRFTSLAVITWSVGTIPAAVGALTPGPWIVRGALSVALALALMAVYVWAASQTRDRKAMADGGRDPPDSDADAGDGDGWLPETRDGGADTDLEPRPDPERDGDADSGPDSDREPEDDADAADSGLVLRASERVRAANWKHMAVFGLLALAFAHDLAAFAAATTIMLSVIALWTRRTLREWRHAARREGRAALALDVVHSLTVTAAALTLPLMLAYAASAFGTGKAIRVGRAVARNAPGETVFALGFLAVMVALAAAVAVLNRFTDLRMGLRRALSVQAVRTALFARALPFALMVITAVLALAVFGGDIVLVLAVTVAVGFIARFAYQVYHYANYRYHTREPRDRTASRVVVNGRAVVDADGEPVYVADVNGHRIAHRRVDPLIGQVRADVRSLFQSGAPESGSFARYYYVNGVRRGKVDMEAVGDELLGDVRTRFEANVKRTDADAGEIRDKLRSEYPSDVVERVVQRLKDRGTVTRREDAFVWLGR